MVHVAVNAGAGATSLIDYLWTVQHCTADGNTRRIRPDFQAASFFETRKPLRFLGHGTESLRPRTVQARPRREDHLKEEQHSDTVTAQEGDWREPSTASRLGPDP